MKKRTTTRELIERIDQRIDDLARATQVGFQDIESRLTYRIGEIDTRLTGRIDTLTTSVDGFVRLHQTLDTELVAVRGKYDRLEERVEKLEAR